MRDSVLPLIKSRSRPRTSRESALLVFSPHPVFFLIFLGPPGFGCSPASLAPYVFLPQPSVAVEGG